MVNRKLVSHSPLYFTTCQIHANYLEDNEILADKNIQKFLDDITCHNYERIYIILQIIGYSMTFKVDLQKSFIFYGPTAGNGKSTLLELITAVIGIENISHVTMHELQERFFSSGVLNKLVNLTGEIERKRIERMEKFKAIVTR